MWQCPVHGTSKVVPAGISKSGKPYSAFMVCAERGCEERPPKNATAPMQRPVQSVGPQRPAAPPPRAAAPNWDKIAEGKVRCAMWCAWAAGNRPMAEYWAHFEDGFRHIMQNYMPGFDERALNEQWDATDPGPGDNDNIFGA